MTATTYPQTPLVVDAPDRWSTPDGYHVSRHGDVFDVRNPAGQTRAVTRALDDAAQAIAALQATGDQYGQPWLAFAEPTTSLY